MSLNDVQKSAITFLGIRSFSFLNPKYQIYTLKKKGKKKPILTFLGVRSFSFLNPKYQIYT
jgi:hypothetical protein